MTEISLINLNVSSFVVEKFLVILVTGIVLVFRKFGLVSRETTKYCCSRNRGSEVLES